MNSPRSALIHPTKDEAAVGHCGSSPIDALSRPAPPQSPNAGQRQMPAQRAANCARRRIELRAKGHASRLAWPRLARLSGRESEPASLNFAGTDNFAAAC